MADPLINYVEFIAQCQLLIELARHLERWKDQGKRGMPKYQALERALLDQMVETGNLLSTKLPAAGPDQPPEVNPYQHAVETAKELKPIVMHFIAEVLKDRYQDHEDRIIGLEASLTSYGIPLKNGKALREESER